MSHVPMDQDYSQIGDPNTVGPCGAPLQEQYISFGGCFSANVMKLGPQGIFWFTKMCSKTVCTWLGEIYIYIYRKFLSLMENTIVSCNTDPVNTWLESLEPYWPLIFTMSKGPKSKRLKRPISQVSKFQNEHWSPKNPLPIPGLPRRWLFSPPDIPAPPIEWSHLQFLQLEWPSWELPCSLWFDLDPPGYSNKRYIIQVLWAAQQPGSLRKSQDTQQAKGQHLLRKHYAHLWGFQWWNLQSQTQVPLGH